MYNKEYFKKLRAERKAAGLCLACGKHSVPCEPCRERNRNYMRNKRAGIPLPERQKSWKVKRDYFLQYKFGITRDDYNEMLKAQGYRCAICRSESTKDKRTKNFPIDHCHKTGKVRGLLCAACNKGIGMLEDSIENLRSAIDYLEKHSK